MKIEDLLLTDEEYAAAYENDEIPGVERATAIKAAKMTLKVAADICDARQRVVETVDGDYYTVDEIENCADMIRARLAALTPDPADAEWRE